MYVLFFQQVKNHLNVFGLTVKENLPDLMNYLDIEGHILVKRNFYVPVQTVVAGS